MNACSPIYYVINQDGHYVRAQRQPINRGDLRCALLLALREFIGDDAPAKSDAPPAGDASNAWSTVFDALLESGIRQCRELLVTLRAVVTNRTEATPAAGETNAAGIGPCLGPADRKVKCGACGSGPGEPCLSPTRPKLPDSSIDARTSLTGVFDNTPDGGYTAVEKCDRPKTAADESRSANGVAPMPDVWLIEPPGVTSGSTTIVNRGICSAQIAAEYERNGAKVTPLYFR